MSSFVVQFVLLKVFFQLYYKLSHAHFNTKMFSQSYILIFCIYFKCCFLYLFLSFSSFVCILLLVAVVVVVVVIVVMFYLPLFFTGCIQGAMESTSHLLSFLHPFAMI